MSIPAPLCVIIFYAQTASLYLSRFSFMSQSIVWFGPWRQFFPFISYLPAYKIKSITHWVAMVEKLDDN